MRLNSGRKSEAGQILKRFLEQAGENQDLAFFVALAYTGLGDRQHALDWLEKAFYQRSGSIRYLKVEPRLNPLRGEPRFQALMHRAGLGD